MGAKHVSIEEEKQIREGIEAGYSLREIAELVGRSYGTIKCYAKKIRNSEASDDAIVTVEPIEDKPKEPEKYISDFKDDPRWNIGGSISIKRIAKIEGKKTGYRYLISDDNPTLVIRNDAGQEFTVERELLGKFMDELNDIDITKNLWN